MSLLWIDSAQWDWLIGAVARIDRNVSRLVGDTKQMEMQMAAIDDAITNLTTQVQANTDAEASAVHLIQQLATLIGASATDPAAVTALAQKLKDSADALAAAVTANTPTPVGTA